MSETNLVPTDVTTPEVAPPQVVEATPDLPVDVPAADLFATADGYRLLVDLPGVDQAGLEVHLEGDLLTLRATPTGTLPEGYERLYGSHAPRRFQRSLRIQDDVDVGRITAVIKDGVLAVELPTAAPKSRRIEVVNDV